MGMSKSDNAKKRKQVSDRDKPAPTIGALIELKWSTDKKWHRGLVCKAARQDGVAVFFVFYEDGDMRWHGPAFRWRTIKAGERGADRDGEAGHGD